MKEGPTGPFRTGERVLVPHTDKFYEAKVLKARKQDDGLWYYLLHYQGWNKKWDEWVEAPGMVKYDKNLVEPKKGRGGNGKGAKRKKLTDIGMLNGNGGLSPDEQGGQVNLTLPSSLKRIVLENWDRINQQGDLLPLPRTPCVDDILKQYVGTSKKTKDTLSPEEEVVNGIRMYFDKALAKLLLYPSEREECSKALANNCTPSSIYGGEHLLRLFLKLPDLLPLSLFSVDHCQALEGRLKNFLDFLVQNQDNFFSRNGTSSRASY